MQKIAKLYSIDDQHLKADIYYSESKTLMPIVLFMHGFKGYKDWGFIPYVCEKFANEGHISVSFDFRFNGIVDIERRIYNPEIFAKNTISQEIIDAQDIIMSLKNDKFIADIWNGKIYIIGHSLGCAIALMIANQFECIKTIALWAPIANFNRYSLRQIQTWKETGKLEFEIFDTKQKMWLGDAFLRDLELNYPKNILREKAKEINVPYLVLHGSEDLTVKPIEGLQIASAGKYSKYIEIEKTGHTFGVHSFFDKPTTALLQIIKETKDFFNK